MQSLLKIGLAMFRPWRSLAVARTLGILSSNCYTCIRSVRVIAMNIFVLFSLFNLVCMACFKCFQKYIRSQVRLAFSPRRSLAPASLYNTWDYYQVIACALILFLWTSWSNLLVWWHKKCFGNTSKARQPKCMCCAQVQPKVTWHFVPSVSYHQFLSKLK